MKSIKAVLSAVGKKWTISTWEILIFGVTILPLNIILIMVTSHYIDSLVELAVETSNSVMEIYTQSLENEVDVISNYLYCVEESDSDFISASVNDMSKEGGVAFYNLSRKLKENVIINNISGIYFIKKEDILAFAVSEETAQYTTEIMDFIKQKNTVPYTGGWQILTVQGQTYLLIGKIQEDLQYGAAVPIDFYFQNIIHQIEFPIQNLSIQHTENVTTSQDLLIQTSMRKFPFYLQLEFHRSAVSGNLSLIQRIEYMIGFLSLLIIPLIYILFNKIFVVPMRNMERFLTRVETYGDYTGCRICAEYYSKELNHFKNAFNGFVERIQDLKIEIYEKELEKQQVQLENVMLQVHPHFLLNIFQLLYSMAQTRSYTGIQRVSLYLSRYFRELFTNPQLHSLEAEIELVEGYADILEIQYPGRFCIIYDIDSAYIQARIPVLMIHSFLENIAKYAIGKKAWIEVEIVCQPKGEFLEITVSDNGVGMAKDILDKINSGESIEKKDGRHIGLSNLKKRLKLIYGERAQLTVKSKENEGTSLLVSIPLGGEENENFIG